MQTHLKLGNQFWFCFWKTEVCVLQPHGVANSWTWLTDWTMTTFETKINPASLGPLALELNNITGKASVWRPVHAYLCVGVYSFQESLPLRISITCDSRDPGQLCFQHQYVIFFEQALLLEHHRFRKHQLNSISKAILLLSVSYQSVMISSLDSQTLRNMIQIQGVGIFLKYNCNQKSSIIFNSMRELMLNLNLDISMRQQFQVLVFLPLVKNFTSIDFN